MTRADRPESNGQLSAERFREFDLLHYEVENRFLRLIGKLEQKRDEEDWISRISEDPSNTYPPITPLLHHSISLPPSTPMRKFYTLLSREVRSYFYSPIAYIVLVFFLFVSGADFYFQLSFMNGRPVAYSVQEAFFNSVFFWFAFVLIFPAHHDAVVRGGI